VCACAVCACAVCACAVCACAVQPEDRVPPLALTGGPGSGKTGLVLDVLSTLGLPHAYVLASACPSLKRLYSAVLRAVGEAVGRMEAGLDGEDSDGGGGGGGGGGGITGDMAGQDVPGGPSGTQMARLGDKFTEFVTRLGMLLGGRATTVYIVRGDEWRARRRRSRRVVRACFGFGGVHRGGHCVRVCASPQAHACMCLYACACTLVRTLVRKRVCGCWCVHVCTFACACARLRVCLHACACTCAHVFVCVCTCARPGPG
jgi:hypothetical protein